MTDGARWISAATFPVPLSSFLIGWQSTRARTAWAELQRHGPALGAPTTPSSEPDASHGGRASPFFEACVWTPIRAFPGMPPCQAPHGGTQYRTELAGGPQY